MTALLASDLTVAVVSGAVGAILVALATFIVGVIVDAIGEGDAVGDVQRFIELSAAGRYSRLPPGPLLIDPDGEASLAISELLAKKEQARQALWGSCDQNRRKRPGIADIDCASDLIVKHRDLRLAEPSEPPTSDASEAVFGEEPVLDLPHR
jgi:hypothetical protein